MSVFLAYYLVSISHIFEIENTIKSWVLKLIYLAAAFLAAAVFIKSLRLFFWEKYKARKNIAQVPNLLRQGIDTIIYLATLLFVLQAVFNIPISGVLTATGALGVVVGLALKEIITDVFSGLILSLDKTIKIGDYVRIEAQPSGPSVGHIAQMNWRTVHIHTPENALVIVPNTILTNNIVVNLSEPSGRKEYELVFTFDFDVASERVIRVLSAALLQTRQILHDPEPVARISRVNGMGVEYKVIYWILPSTVAPGDVRNHVIDNVLFHLHQSGLTPSYPKSDMFTAGIPVRNLNIREDRIGLLHKIELFSILSDPEISEMAASLVERKIGKDEFAVRMGETGDSMFILVEGLMDVILRNQKNNADIKVAQLKPGSYFGEMSLLTGEPRSASIGAVCDSLLFEIPKESMVKILNANTEVAEVISRKIADIRLKNEAAFQEKSSQDKESSRNELSRSILWRIRNFFRL